MKKLYLTPAVKARKTMLTTLVMQSGPSSSSVNKIETKGYGDSEDPGIVYGGGGSGPAYAPRWGDDWE